MLELTADQLHEAIGHLYEALSILQSVLKEIGSGAIGGLDISNDLGEAWFEVNCCRLHTQLDLNLEELNLEAMALINDAKCMMESLVSWKTCSTIKKPESSPSGHRRMRVIYN